MDEKQQKSNELGFLIEALTVARDRATALGETTTLGKINTMLNKHHAQAEEVTAEIVAEANAKAAEASPAPAEEPAE